MKQPEDYGHEVDELLDGLELEPELTPAQIELLKRWEADITA
jgi:hypothetical protein